MAPPVRPGSHIWDPIEVQDGANDERDDNMDGPRQLVYGELGQGGLHNPTSARRPAGRPPKETKAQHRRLSKEESRIRRRARRIALAERPIVIEDEDQARPAADLEAEIPFVDLTSEGPLPLPSYRYTGPRNHIPTPDISTGDGERLMLEYARPSDGLPLRRGMTVEIDPHEGRFEADFLKIAAVLATPSGDIKLRGHIYTRNRHLLGYLQRRVNEVVLVANVVKADARDWNRQAMVDIDPGRVVCVRHLRTTNAMHSEYGIDRKSFDEMGRKWVSDHGVLVCRWQYVLVHHDHDKLRAQRADEWLLRRVTERDADKLFVKKDATNLAQWRGGKVCGGSVTEQGKHEAPVVDLHVDDEPCPGELQGQRRFYSGGDMFAGAGGTSRGMVKAGIRILFALDHWDVAAATYRKNFPNTEFYEMDAFDFYVGEMIKYRVDILHLSPPCQYYSPAHTIPGKNDGVNMACLFVCGHIIEKIRPRVFTIEQTFGLMRPQHEQFFNGLVGDLTKHGYSVRWKVVHFNNWGLCQKRRRLIFIGVAPGEHLPDFPADSHGDGLRHPFARVEDAVPDIDSDLSIQHDKEGAIRRSGGDSWDPSGLLPRTITCSGGGNVHWTGERDFTVREYAWLQGFPTTHSFQGTRTECVKQIGNAVPPNMAKKLFRHIVNWLKVQDGVCTVPQDIVRSRIREGFERIKIGDDEDDDLVFAGYASHIGSTPERPISISSGAGETSTDTVAGTEVDAGQGMAAFEDTGIPPRDREHQLRPFDRFWPETDIELSRGLEHCDLDDEYGEDEAAQSDDTCTMVGDDDDIGMVDLDPPQRIGSYSLQRRVVIAGGRRQESED